MPQIINTNIASINAQRNLDKSQAENQTALQRLSSGLRINSAKDDAAGLAISTRFTAQVQGLAVAIRNASDGVSLAQTAEGALGSMTDNLLRIRDLALQASNATNGKADREALNEEVQQLKAEISRVAEQTSFNGTNLLDGTFSQVTFQIGANEGETVSFGIEGTNIDQLGTASTDGISSDPGSSLDVPSTAVGIAAGDLVINGVAVGASTGVDDAFSSGNQEASAIAKAAAINNVADLTGVSATVNGTFVSGSAAYDNTAGAATVVINGITIPLSVDATLSDTVNLGSVAQGINASSGQTGVTATFSGNPAQGVQLQAADGRNIIIADGTGTASDYGIAAAATYTGSYSLVSDDGTPISLDTTTGNITNGGLAVGVFSGANSGAVGQEVPAANMAAGDIVINGVPVGPALANFDSASPANGQQSAIAKAEAINQVRDKTGVEAIVNSTILNGAVLGAAPVAAGSGSFDINDVTINISYSAVATVTDRQNAIVTAINNKAGQSGVAAEAFGSTFRLIADDGRNIVVDNYVTLPNAIADLGLPTDPTTTQGSITLLSAGIFSVGSFGLIMWMLKIEDEDSDFFKGLSVLKGRK